MSTPPRAKVKGGSKERKLCRKIFEYYFRFEMDRRYEVRSKIGQGSFGSVFIAVDKHSRKTYVVKEIRTAKLTGRELADVTKEVQLLSQLVHPHIVEYVESFEDNKFGGWVMLKTLDREDGRSKGVNEEDLVGWQSSPI